MNRRLKSLLVLLVCCNLITTTAIADELSDAKNKSESIKVQIENDKQKINELQKNRDELLSEMNSIDKQLNSVYDDIDNLNAKIKISNEKIIELESRKIELRKSLDDDKELMSKRYRTLYKSNGTNYLELLLESDGFGDFLKKLDAVIVMAKHNNNVILKYEKLQEELGENIRKTNDEKKLLEDNKLELDIKLKEIENQKLAKKDFMKSIEDDLESAEALLAENEAEFNKVLESIKTMEEAADNRPSRGDEVTSSKDEVVNSESSQVSSSGMYSITGTRYAITSPFGPRYSPVSGKSEFHNGIDIGAPYGAPVYSLKDGVVSYSGWMSGYGKVVVINHGDISTLYAHNSELSVNVGQRVSGGQKIANVGSTGWSTGPHIHFEVISGGKRINSAPYYF